MNEYLWMKVPFTGIPILVVVALIGAWFLFRNRATRVESKTGFDGQIGSGRPVVMGFFSNM